jgi:hypothetical protein
MRLRCFRGAPERPFDPAMIASPMLLIGGTWLTSD